MDACLAKREYVSHHGDLSVGNDIVYSLFWLPPTFLRLLRISNQQSSSSWKKFTVVTQNTYNFVPGPITAYPPSGIFLLNQGAVGNLKLSQIVGNFNQVCILPVNCNTCPQNGIPSYECKWTFSLSLSGARPGTITLQGTFAYPCFPQSTFTFPEQQYAVITGGTGCFRSLIGVAKIQPYSTPFTCTAYSNASPILLLFTFYIKEVS